MEAQQKQPRKNFGKDSKRASVELWRVGVAWATIRKQLKMSESTLRRILAIAKKNPTLFPPRSHAVSGRPSKAPGGDCAMSRY